LYIRQPPSSLQMDGVQAGQAHILAIAEEASQSNKRPWRLPWPELVAVLESTGPMAPDVLMKLSDEARTPAVDVLPARRIYLRSAMWWVLGMLGCRASDLQSSFPNRTTNERHPPRGARRLSPRPVTSYGAQTRPSCRAHGKARGALEVPLGSQQEGVHAAPQHLLSTGRRLRRSQSRWGHPEQPTIPANRLA
jgi:hypothetical protein